MCQCPVLVEKSAELFGDFVSRLASDYDVEEVLTYEQVMLVEPHPEKRRPVVLVGEFLYFFSFSRPVPRGSEEPPAQRSAQPNEILFF